jgi:hypothetical protein
MCKELPVILVNNNRIIGKNGWPSRRKGTIPPTNKC